MNPADPVYCLMVTKANTGYGKLNSCVLCDFKGCMMLLVQGHSEVENYGERDAKAFTAPVLCLHYRSLSQCKGK